MNKKIQLMVTTAMLAALACVATMIIKVPTIGTNGYVNIGDTIVLVSAWLLGIPFGAVAAGVGSALADFLAGYGTYVPGTFVIKFCMALVAYAIYAILRKTKLPKIVNFIISGVFAELVMVFGYFLYESTLLGYGFGAAASIPSNMIQGVTCLVLGVILIMAMLRVKYFKLMMLPKEKKEKKKE